jgi:ribosomal-protein-alanine N-acetyltransferase
VLYFENDMDASIRTQRLLIVPLTLTQLQLCTTDLPALEAELGLSISRDVFTDVVWGAIHKKIEKMTGMPEAHHSWQTYWLVVVNENNFGAGLAGFKGYPDKRGSSEIGYGIDPAYQNKGYMTEAVKALVDWALLHPFCRRVTATTVQNPASRRLLEKLGARLVAEDGTATFWEFRQ